MARGIRKKRISINFFILSNKVSREKFAFHLHKEKRSYSLAANLII